MGLRLSVRCVFLVCLVLSQPAFAQQAQTQLSGADQEARALFMAAQVAFDEGRFESAVQYFVQSYQLSHRPELLYNIGNTYDRLQQPEQALQYFEQYLQERPNAENSQQVQARARLLRQSVDARRNASPSPTATSAMAPGSAPTAAETARAHQEVSAPLATSSPNAPEAATQESEGGGSWMLWAGVGAAAVVVTVVVIVLATSGGDETQSPVVPMGATVVQL